MGPPTTRGGRDSAGDSHPVAGPTPCGVTTGRSAAEDRWRGAWPGTAGTHEVDPARAVGRDHGRRSGREPGPSPPKERSDW